MFYTYDKVYRSVTYFITQLVPSGVTVTDGESYGVRLDDPTGNSPSVAVTIEEAHDQPLELGSASIQFQATITINAASRLQRAALKSIIHSGLINNPIPIYTSFVNFIPDTFEIEKYAEPGDYFSVRDMPNFSTNRDKFYWVSVIFVDLDVLGV